MQITDAFRGPQGAELIGAIARSAGIDGQQAVAAIQSLMPALLYGFERNTLSRGGLADLLKALGSGHHAAYLDPQAIGSPAMIDDGNRILSHVVGSETRIDGVIARAASDSGLSATVLRTILPSLAALVMGWLFANGKGALGDVLNRVPRVDPGAGGSAGGILRGPGSPSSGAGSSRAGGGPLSIPDLDQINLPGGRGDNPYGDLGDVLKRQGGSGGLAEVIRNILGGLLGFGNKGGIVSWIIRFIVLRWGWTIVKFLFRRLFIGR